MLITRFYKLHSHQHINEKLENKLKKKRKIQIVWRKGETTPTQLIHQITTDKGFRSRRIFFANDAVLYRCNLDNRKVMQQLLKLVMSFCK